MLPNRRRGGGKSDSLLPQQHQQQQQQQTVTTTATTTTATTRSSSVASHTSTTTSNLNNFSSLDNPRRAMRRLHEEEQQRQRSSTSASNSLARSNKKTSTTTAAMTQLSHQQQQQQQQLQQQRQPSYLSQQHLDQHNENKTQQQILTKVNDESAKQDEVNKERTDVNATTSTTVTTTATTSFRRKSFAPLHLQSHLHKWLTDATPLLESWSSLGLLIPPPCWFSREGKMVSKQSANLSLASSSSSSPTVIDHTKVLEFLVSIDKTAISTIAKIAVQDACQVWSEARRRVLSSSSSCSFFDLALQVCSVGLLTRQEQELVGKCARVFDLSVPVAIPSDFSCAVGVEKAVRIVSEIEKLLDAAKVILSCNRKIQKAILSCLVAAQNDNKNSSRNPKKNAKSAKNSSSSSTRRDDGSSNDTTKISTRLLPTIGCDEVHSLLQATSSTTSATTSTISASKNSAVATAPSTKVMTMMMALSPEEAKHPSSGFYFLQYSSFRGAGIRFVSGSALHRRRLHLDDSNDANGTKDGDDIGNDERRRVLKYLIQKVDMLEGLPLYMRAAAATAANSKNNQRSLPTGSSSSSTKNEDSAQHVDSDFDVDIDDDHDDDDDNHNHRRLAVKIFDQLSANRSSARSRNKAAGPLGFLPDITDLPPQEFAIQVHTAEQLSREVADICRQNISFDLYVGQPHEVILAATARGSFGDSHKDFFSKMLPFHVCLSETKQFFDEKLEIGRFFSPLREKEQQGEVKKKEEEAVAVEIEDAARTEKEKAKADNAEELLLPIQTAPTPRSSTSGRFKFNFSSFSSSQHQSSQIDAAAATTKNNNNNNNNNSNNNNVAEVPTLAVSSQQQKVTRGEALICQMYVASRAAEHKGRCWGIVVGSVDDGVVGGVEQGARKKQQFEYVAGVVELMLSVPSLLWCVNSGH